MSANTEDTVIDFTKVVNSDGHRFDRHIHRILTERRQQQQQPIPASKLVGHHPEALKAGYHYFSAMPDHPSATHAAVFIAGMLEDIHGLKVETPEHVEALRQTQEPKRHNPLRLAYWKRLVFGS